MLEAIDKGIRRIPCLSPNQENLQRSQLRHFGWVLAHQSNVLYTDHASLHARPANNLMFCKIGLPTIAFWSDRATFSAVSPK